MQLFSFPKRWIEFLVDFLDYLLRLPYFYFSIFIVIRMCFIIFSISFFRSIFFLSIFIIHRTRAPHIKFNLIYQTHNTHMISIDSIRKWKYTREHTHTQTRAHIIQKKYEQLFEQDIGPLKRSLSAKSRRFSRISEIALVTNCFWAKTCYKKRVNFSYNCQCVCDVFIFVLS